MPGGGGEQPSTPLNGGEFLLQLLKNPPHLPPQPPPQQSQVLSQGPAVAAQGPRLPVPFSPPIHHSNNGLTPPWVHHNTPSLPPPFAPHNFFVQNSNSSPNSKFNLASSSGVNFIPNSSSNSNFNPAGVNFGSHQNVQLGYNNRADDFVGKLGSLGPNHKKPSSTQQQQEQKDITFGSMMGNEYIRNVNASQNSLISQRGKDKMQMPTARRMNGLEVENHQSPIDFDRERQSTGAVNYGSQGHNGHNNYKAAVPAPGFPGKQMVGGNREYSNRRNFGQTGERGISSYVEFGRHGHKGQNKNRRERERRFELKNERNTGDISDDRRRISDQLDSPGQVPGRDFHTVSASNIEESMMELHGEDDGRRETMGIGLREKKKDDPRVQSDLDDLEEQLVDSLDLEDESGERSNKKKSHGTRDKDYRSDKRGQSILGPRMRYMKRQMLCRADINRLDAPFVAIYESLIPPEEEKAKQKQLLSLLEKVVIKEWPDARLYIYGSCANSFGFLKSDIDICLTLDDVDASKSKVLLKLADMLQSENFQNVQAITQARVPIVKLMDPATGISCDICINNVLAVINTKLLWDYAQIDVRLRQLAFIVKHWAKSRGVNETYQGTLSSYAYVLMCIHFLQQRRPPILPCLQKMKTTHNVTVDNVVCAYFDEVEHLGGFGSNNQESIAQLVWSFFNYWAYRHGYTIDVISVRTGSTLRKRTKDWTRRIGNDRHLICIEDPFELTHDLGRVVDKRSIKVLREEFERAAEIMQYDFNPCVNLFEPYIPT